MKETKGIVGRFKQEWKYLTFDVGGYMVWTVEPIFYPEMDWWALSPEEFCGDYTSFDELFCMSFDNLPTIDEEDCGNNIWRLK